MPTALCLMAYGLWLIAHGSWLMAHALCLMPKPYALCFMPNALCLMLYALCLNILHKIDYKKHILSCSTSTIIASATNKNLYILSACLVSYHRYRHTYGVWLMAYALCLMPYAFIGAFFYSLFLVSCGHFTLGKISILTQDNICPCT